MRVLFLLSLLLVTACLRFPDSYPEEELTGRVFVLWVGEGSGSLGDGRFVFVPDAKDRLVLRRKGKPDIKPGLMYTDGGSIPRGLQALRGLQPWGYAPAYMLHDWLFVAHHCYEDGNHDAPYDQVAGMDFHDTVVVMGSALRALMDGKLVKRDDTAGGMITLAVNSSFTRKLWNDPVPCDALLVSKTDADAVYKFLPPGSRPPDLRVAPAPPDTGGRKIVRSTPKPTVRLMGVVTLPAR